MIRGIIWVVICQDDNGIPSEHDRHIVKLHAGETYIVGAGLWHRFEVIEDGELLETYWAAFEGAKVRVDDIERHVLGGRVSS